MIDVATVELDDLRVELAQTLDQALELADELAAAAVGVDEVSSVQLAALGSQYRIVRSRARALRNELKMLVAG